MENNSLDLKTTFEVFASHQKNVTSLSDSILRSVNFYSGNELFSLVPVTKLDLGNVDRIELLAAGMLFTQDTSEPSFKYTFDNTKKWINDNVIESPNTLMYWITDQYLKIYGHVGLGLNKTGNRLQIENVFRLNPGHKGLMSNAISAIEKLSETEFSVENIFLYVPENNLEGKQFFEQLGYSNSNGTSRDGEIEHGNSEPMGSFSQSEIKIEMEKNILSLVATPDVILTAGPSISSFELVNSVDAVMNGWNQNHSGYLKKFESEFANYVGAKYALATSSCTGALHLSLLAAGIGPGDEVIVPDITWVATASAVRYVGAKPVFADVNPEDWTLELSDLSSKLTPNTKAIIPVHLYGYAANISKIIEFANLNDLLVIEDAAPSIGTSFNNKKVGTFGDIGCFSFQGAKLLVTGEGGMLVTDNEEIYKRAYKIQDHGRRPGTFWIETLGYKYKMNNVTAGLGLGQLTKVENQIFRKRRINSWYLERLADLKTIKFQKEISGSRSINWMTSFTLSIGSKISRDVFISELSKKGIDTRPVFPSISQYKIWGYTPETPANSKYIGEQGINLPSGANLSIRSVDRITKEIRELLS
jgi:perosamine synthetase